MLRAILGFAFGVMVACSEGVSGVPHQGDAPQGADLARSELARDSAPTFSADDAKTFAGDNRAFALAVYRELAKEQGNLFFSPYSISTALAMTYAGAKGETASEMASALHFSLDMETLHPAFNATDHELAKRKDELPMSDSRMPSSGDGFRFNLVNQAWGRKGYQFLDSYLDVLAQNYGAGLFLVEFSAVEAARTLINGWVEEQTEKRIKDLLPEGSLSADTALVLTNAIYFKASWLDPFDAGKTADAKFRAAAGERSVAMMHATLDGRYAEQDGYAAVWLPYLSKHIGMLAVLPPEGSFDSVATGLDNARLDALLGKLSRHSITLSLPKWTFESERTLKAPLRALGMRAAFGGGTADFSGMDGKPGQLYIDEVYHKAFVAVDEEGTEAAAATAVVIKEVSAPPQVSIAFDRPFIFLIYDEPTGQILFLGHLVDPG